MNDNYDKTLERIYQLACNCPDPNKREGKEGWSIKEVIGHLLDSLSNNHQRLARYKARGHLDFPAYDQEAFVRRCHYGSFEFHTLLSLWYTYNRLFLHIVANIPQPELDSTIRVGDRPAVTIGQLIQDYFAHMEIHERQISRIIRST